MSDPVEIMARALCAETCAFYGDPPCARVGHDDFDCGDVSCNTKVKAALTALEASGWRLVHPDLISEGMKRAGDQCTEGRDLTHECIAQAIRSAPTYGDNG